VVGPVWLRLCEASVLIDSAAVSGCCELASRTTISTTASESRWSTGTPVRGEGAAGPDAPKGRPESLKHSPSSCSSVE
jgi:hypothetical protein